MRKTLCPPPRQTVSRVKNFYPLQIKNIALEKYFLLLLPLLRFIKIQNKQICLMPPSSPFLPSSPLPSCSPLLGMQRLTEGLATLSTLSTLCGSVSSFLPARCADGTAQPHLCAPPPPPQHLRCNKKNNYMIFKAGCD